MNTTPKKTHIYAVEVSRSDTPLIKVFVRAESKAQARAAIANTMIHVERASQDDLLGVTREQVIDGTREPAPDQVALPLEPTTGASDGEAVATPEPFGADFIAAIQSDETAAQQLEPGHDAE